MTVFEIVLISFELVAYHIMWFSMGYFHGRFVERDKQINREIKENEHDGE